MTDVVEDGEVTIVEKSSLAVITSTMTEFEKVQAGLAQLCNECSSLVFDVTTSKGMEDAKALRNRVREPRYAVKHMLDAAKKPLNDLKKDLIAKADYITTELLAIEKPIDDKIKAEEDRKESERQAKIAAEQKRINDIQQRIAQFAGAVHAVAGGSVRDIADAYVAVNAVVIDESFAEFADQAAAAKAWAVEQLDKMGVAAFDREHEAAEAAAKLAAEREADEQQRLANERMAAQLKAQQDEFNRRMAEQQAAIDAQRQQLEAERAAEQRAKNAAAKSEADRVAAVQKAEEDRIAAGRKAEADRRAEEAGISTALRQQTEHLERKLRALAIHAAVVISLDMTNDDANARILECAEWIKEQA